MRPVTIHLLIALSLLSVGLSALRAETHGKWTLEHNRSNILTLSFKHSTSIHNQLTTSELAFMCGKRDRSGFVGAILVPFDGTFQSRRDGVPVLIQKNADQYDGTDLIQNWKNGSEFLFLDTKDDIADLRSFFKEKGADLERSVHIYFSNDVEDGPPTSNHIVIDASGYSEGNTAFQKACAGAQ